MLFVDTKIKEVFMTQITGDKFEMHQWLVVDVAGQCNLITMQTMLNRWLKIFEFDMFSIDR